ncbi:DHHW family protein [Clostridium sp. LIBA-8841]|uniref:DHHW family protein n=1 Tax=Clostridium sp. LIBA-8841 TaxID=2987530 RepID=UPI002AC5D31C|nr:DHHW family protein [Clostridium sp. LIBA-8841]MDZ5252405.1 DHHW family protein [Clostridium sp. LIBA-8841]
MKKYPMVFIFFSLVVTFAAFDMSKKNIDFSEFENRILVKKPKFSLDAFISGTYSRDYEEYINDNFIFREKWINLKSISEYALGKIENNNIVYGKENYMFDKIISYDEERFNNNLKALKEFINGYNGRVTTMIVPNSYTIYEEYIPWGLKLLEQEELISKVYEVSNKDTNIDLIKLLTENKEDYIYYKTDHHWTTYGAYLAYGAYMESLGEKPIELRNIEKHEVSGFYGTYFSKSKLFNAESDILTYYDINNATMEIQGESFNNLYDYEKLNTIDKYSFFIRGNNGLTIIRNHEVKNGEKLLVFKDSFANSMIPFLSENFEEIHVVDLRDFPFKVSEYMENENFNDALILYNMDNFLRDVNIIRLKY